MTYNEKKSLYECIMKEVAKTVKRQINETDVASFVSFETILKRRGFKRYEQPENTWFLPIDNYDTNEIFIFKEGWCIQKSYNKKFYFCKKLNVQYTTPIMLLNNEQDLDNALKMFGIELNN